MLLGGCSDRQAGVQISETRLLLDTACTIAAHGDFADGELEIIISEAFDYISELESLLSVTLEGSDVWRINHAGGEPVTVDERTLEVIKAGLSFGRLSNGMFDITIGRVSRLWNFGIEQNVQGTVPASSELFEAIGTVDYRQVIISGDTVQLGNPDAWIDLGAIAKGYIGDKVAGLLKERGVSGALINLGGDVVALGNRHDGTPWRVALRDPGGSTDEWLGVVEAANVSVIASGTYERRFELDGVIYHHIIDPKTGMPVKSDIVSATFINKDAMVGEGLSTIAVLLGSDRASVFFDSYQGFVGAVLVLENGELLEFGEVELLY